MELLSHAHAAGNKVKSRRYFLAAMIPGHLHVLKWLHTNGARLYLSTLGIAAKRGHLEILKWASANGTHRLVSLLQIAVIWMF